MARTTIEAERRLPFAPADLCRLVGDVRAYPKFIPWLKSLRVLREAPLPEQGWQGTAEAVVGWKAITERFATDVRCDPAKGEVDVTLVKGPFRTLENRWRFSDDGAGGAKVKFWIAYEFKNPVLQAVVTANRDVVAARIMGAFVAEAERRLSPAGAAKA
jgi:coenzyme Q-binding protein COQ10